MSENFDSLASSNGLIRGGFPREQAQALVSAMFRLIDSQLATKSDLSALGESFDHKLEKLSLDFDRKLEKLRAEIIQWMFGVMILQSGVTALLFKLMH